jgi:hypothetical protein
MTIQNSSSEYEIKLLFPSASLAAIEKLIISKGGVRRQHLEAAYIDTPDFLLTRSGIALRIRKEGRQWVQTLKLSTSNSLERIEHNVTLDSHAGSTPDWSLDYHHEHQAGVLLHQLLPNLAIQDLQIRYQTDIWRRKALLKTRTGLLEYALDEGRIYINVEGVVRSEPVHELEIELKEGQPIDVLRHAQSMMKRFKAYLDTRSKSERGYLLACEHQVSPPTRASAISLNKASSANEIIDFMIHSCLGQILPNQSVLNTEYADYAEHLHQLRVGLRRLKTILKYLSRYHIALSDTGKNSLDEIFKRLGAYRDDNFISEILNPLLISHNGPPVDIKDAQTLPHPQFLTRSNAFQLLLIEVMSLGQDSACQSRDDIAIEENISAVKKRMLKLINKSFEYSALQASKLNELEDSAIHVLRKKLKFLRYSLEFFKDFCERKKYQPFFKLLSDTLDHLGDYNDIHVAIERIESMATTNPNLLFALGWLKAERLRVRGLCEKSIKKLFLQKTAW